MQQASSVQPNPRYFHQFLSKGLISTADIIDNQKMINQREGSKSARRPKLSTDFQTDKLIKNQVQIAKNQITIRNIGSQVNRKQESFIKVTDSYHKVRRCNTESISPAGLFDQQKLEFPKIPYFPKPYLQNTKFVDLLVKNKQLLRRGPFDLPLEKLNIPKQKHIKLRQGQKEEDRTCHPSPMSKRQQELLNTCIKARKQVKQMIQNQKTKRKLKKVKLFYTTVEDSTKQYQKMLEDQEADPRMASNLINRFISIDQVLKKVKTNKN